MNLEAASPQVKNKLVALYDTQRLHELAHDNRNESRSQLIAMITDLFGTELSWCERELVADILIALVRRAGKTLRSHLSKELASRADVPERLILALAQDEIDVAGPVLRNSPCLSTLDLIYIVKSMDVPYWRAIAKRADLDDELMNTLVDTQDPGTAIALAKNANIALNTHTANKLSSMACDYEDLAGSLVMRGDVPDSLIRMVYTHVSQRIRDYIHTHYQIDDALMSDINDVLAHYEELPKRHHTPSREEVEEARQNVVDDEIHIKHMLAHLQEGYTQRFVAQFAAFTGLSVAVVQDMCAQENGQGLAVACRACNVKRADFVNLYLLTRHMANLDPQFSNNPTRAALSYYDRISAKLAQRIMRSSRASQTTH